MSETFFVDGEPMKRTLAQAPYEPRHVLYEENGANLNEPKRPPGTISYRNMPLVEMQMRARLGKAEREDKRRRRMAMLEGELEAAAASLCSIASELDHSRDYDPRSILRHIAEACRAAKRVAGDPDPAPSALSKPS